MCGTVQAVLLPPCHAEQLHTPLDASSETWCQRLIPSQRDSCSPASAAGFGWGQPVWVAAHGQDFGRSRACSSCSAAAAAHGSCPVPKSRAARPWLSRTLLAQELPAGMRPLLPPTWILWSDEEGNDGRGERGPGGPARPGAGKGSFAGTVQAGRGREEEAVCSPGGQYSGSSCHGNCAAVPDAANFEVHPGWNQPKNNNKTLWVLRWICRIAVVSVRRVHPCCRHAAGTWQPSWTFMGPYKRA